MSYTFEKAISDELPEVEPVLREPFLVQASVEGFYRWLREETEGRGELWSDAGGLTILPAEMPNSRLITVPGSISRYGARWEHEDAVIRFEVVAITSSVMEVTASCIPEAEAFLTELLVTLGIAFQALPAKLPLRQPSVEVQAKRRGRQPTPIDEKHRVVKQWFEYRAKNQGAMKADYQEQFCSLVANVTPQTLSTWIRELEAMTADNGMPVCDRDKGIVRELPARYRKP